jgi:hypothetical protein
MDGQRNNCPEPSCTYIRSNYFSCATQLFFLARMINIALRKILLQFYLMQTTG